MLTTEHTASFASLNAGYQRLFSPQRLTVGLVVPIEAYPDSPLPGLHAHVQRVQRAEELGFGAVWLRDIPFNVPAFGDAGQIHDPFVYLGLLAGQTRSITLGVSSIVLPLRHPVHVAKAAASVDVLSGGRLVLGVASGDRPQEYPRFGVDYASRGEGFRASYAAIRELTAPQAQADGLEVLPKPHSGRLPMMITGSSQQSNEWLAQHGDGWMTYPREAPIQSRLIAQYRQRSQAQGLTARPVMEPLYIDLAEDPQAPAQKIHLGYRLGVHRLRDYLHQRQQIGVNHVALNLRFNRAPTEHTLQQLADHVLAHFPTHKS